MTTRTRFGLIGGTGALSVLPDAQLARFDVATPYGDPSSRVVQWQSGTRDWLFLSRHGDDGLIPPHCVNYRANVWALRQAGCDRVIGINAVGGIHADAVSGALVFPSQLIDYTWGREHTFADGTADSLQHVEFTSPVATRLRERLIAGADEAGLDYISDGTYAVTQGPRLETAAEIDRLERDGCDIVGMTAMPEAGLARELGLEYAICAVVVNRAAGRGASTGIHAEIDASLRAGMTQVQRLLAIL